MNIDEITALKEKSQKNTPKIFKEYNDWIKEIRILPNWIYWIILFSSAGFIFYFKLSWNSWITILLVIISLRSLFKISHREGHKEGYLDGYNSGFNDGVNQTLGIDKSDEKFINEVQLDKELNKQNKSL